LLPGGDWVVSWGFNSYMTELDSQGVPRLTISYQPTSLFSYRVAPVAASIAALRLGMDAMVPPLDHIASTILVPAAGDELRGAEFLDAGTPYVAGVTKVEFRATGGSLHDAIVATAQPTRWGWIGSWNTSSVADGTYGVQAVVYSDAGAIARTPSIALIVGNSPTTSVLVPGSGATLSGASYLDARAVDAGGNAGITKVEFRATGGSLHDAVVATAAPTIYGWIGQWNTNAAANGSYTLQSVVYNRAGSVARSPSIAVTVHNGA
jgi:hypothetical protein